MSKESDHRLLNGLQMIVSLLSLQSRASANAEAASQLARRGRSRGHDRARSPASPLFGWRTNRRIQAISSRIFVAISPRCCPRSERPERVIVVEGVEIKLPTVTAIPLGFIVNELITNAAKYGKGRITVRLEPNPGKGYALSVSNDGPGLPEGFDPAACNGLGMRIIRSFVERIGGELRIGRGDNNQGTRFTVLFCNSGKSR